MKRCNYFYSPFFFLYLFLSRSLILSLVISLLPFHFRLPKNSWLQPGNLHLGGAQMSDEYGVSGAEASGRTGPSSPGTCLAMITAPRKAASPAELSCPQAARPGVLLTVPQPPNAPELVPGLG